jgi:hypothetical protein
VPFGDLSDSMSENPLAMRDRSDDLSQLSCSCCAKQAATVDNFPIRITQSGWHSKESTPACVSTAALQAVYARVSPLHEPQPCVMLH